MHVLQTGKKWLLQAYIGLCDAGKLPACFVNVLPHVVHLGLRISFFNGVILSGVLLITAMAITPHMFN